MNYRSIDVSYISHLVLSTLNRYLVCSALDRVSSTSVTMSHLIAYDPEKDLLPLILAHCNYSLEVGQETLVHYDWAALERQLIDRFLRGRPFVEFKVSVKEMACTVCFVRKLLLLNDNRFLLSFINSAFVI